MIESSKQNFDSQACIHTFLGILCSQRPDEISNISDWISKTMASSLSLDLLIVFLKIPGMKKFKKCKVIRYYIFILINDCFEIPS